LFWRIQYQYTPGEPPGLLKFICSLAVSGNVSCWAARRISCCEEIHTEAEAFRVVHIAVQQGVKMDLNRVPRQRSKSLRALGALVEKGKDANNTFSPSAQGKQI